MAGGVDTTTKQSVRGDRREQVDPHRDGVLDNNELSQLIDFSTDSYLAQRANQEITEQRQEGEFVRGGDGSFLSGVDRARGGNDSSEGNVLRGPWGQRGSSFSSGGESLQEAGAADAVTPMEAPGQVIDIQRDPRYQQQIQALQQQQDLSASSITSKEREELAREIQELEQWLSLALARERYTKEELMHIYACIGAMARIRLEELLTEAAQQGELEATDEDLERESGNPRFEDDGDEEDESHGKGKFLSDFTAVPLMKKLMGRESVRFQRLWKALDSHLEEQIGKEEVKEEMYKNSF